MTIEEIFKSLASHMKKGMMLHQELANYYDFLHLCGYKKCHEYHYLDESCGYRKLQHFYIDHFNKLIEKEEEAVKREDIIPSSWYKHMREDVDTSLKRQAVETGMKTWINWQRETKELYQRMFQELMDLNEVAAAMFLKCYICDVTKELKCAEHKYLDIKVTDYDISEILDRQEKDHKKYKKKIKEYKVC